MPKCVLKSNRFPGIAYGRQYYAVGVPMALSDSEVEHLRKLIAPMGRDFTLTVDSSPGTDSESLALLDAAISRCHNTDTLRYEIGLLPRTLRASFAARLHQNSDIHIHLKQQAEEVLRQFEECHEDASAIARKGNSATSLNYF